MRIKQCIFDLDGVVVNTARIHFLVWRRIANELGFDFTKEQNEELKGVGRKKSLETILTWGKLKLSEKEKSVWLTKKNDFYLEMIEDLNRSDMLPGVLQFIEHLKKIGVRIALGSASKNARHILNTLELSNDFDVIVDGNDVVNGKPHPETFLKTLSPVSMEAREAIVFEDSFKGLEAALHGGFYAVGIGSVSNLSNAHLVLSGFQDLDFSNLIVALEKVIL